MSSVPDELYSLIPQSLRVVVENYWHDWSAACQKKAIDPAASLPLPETGMVWACSDFVARNCIRYPQMFLDLLADGMAEQRSLDEYSGFVETAVAQGSDEGQLMKNLRELRQREMLRIAWRDLNQLAAIETILQELSDLAEAMVSEVIRSLQQRQAEIFGMPSKSNGEPQSLLVFAMGKMGGGELNFSSDIDLIFCFAEDGETSGPRKTSYSEFYLGVIRKLVKVLDEVTVDGFVYRVDTRLRPFGQSGPMAMSFSGLEQYYQLHGRDWERYAMIKAKLITGSEDDRRHLRSMLTPFVYRRYLDFSMIDSIREMKAMINTQMQRKGMSNNIKLGRGGIREIEFIGQTLQLIRAGREPELRVRGIISVLKLLAEKDYLADTEVDDLIRAYGFLRKLENRLQMLADKQTHTLPDDELSQQRIALAMSRAMNMASGDDDWQTLQQQLAVHQQAVDQVFQHLIRSEADESESHSSAFTLFWEDTHKPRLNEAHSHDAHSHDTFNSYLSQLGYQQPEQITAVLVDLHTGSAIKQLSGDSVRLMTRLLESLLQMIASYPQQVELLDRVARVLKALAGRKVYLSLLDEYPAIQQQMLRLCAASEWFTERLLRYPILLDSVLNAQQALAQSYDVRQLLSLELDRVDRSDVVGNVDLDLEQLMERMRQFKRQTVFGVAMLDVFYEEPVESVSDRLTDLADALLEKILQYSWQTVVARHGEPQYELDGERKTASMAIIGYGKLGGNELGYGSDLDIIFVHNSQGERQYTAGEKSLDNQQFFARVAQRVIHFLNTRTYSGVLYEADTRLRPDGQAGLMVSNLEAYERYQKEKAWTWEHQALIRARFITENSHGDVGHQDTGRQDIGKGNALIEQEFDRIRGSVLRRQGAQQPDAAGLLEEVVAMRSKMRKHLANKSDSVDIKQDAGGLVDIEFMTQAGVLIHAQQHAECIRHTATLRLINELEKVGFYTKQDASHLAAAYRTFRKMKNWQNLQCDINGIASHDEIEKHRNNVIAIWNRLMPEFVE